MSSEADHENHQPVMLSEVLTALACNTDEEKSYVDCTLGLGGHAMAILAATALSSRLIGIDRDEEALRIANQRIGDQGGRFTSRKGTFQDLVQIVADSNRTEVDGILFDFGISSFQLDTPERGFSFQNQGPLDMRMDRQSGLPASELLNQLRESEIKTMIQTFGEERWAGRIASAITRHRDEEGKILRTEDLENIIWHAVPSRFRHGRTHPATRTFQALRMAVNNELEQISIGLEAAIPLLAVGGRLVVISFHSLEDRKVKQCFKAWSKKYPQKGEKQYINLFKKPLIAGPDECSHNSRARSAKLRVLERAA
jgi:16S rRNA (cytosine1402-N4)-methyltransferase